MSAAPPLVLSYSEASEVVREHAAHVAAEHLFSQQELPLLKALGRVLAAPLLADRDQPPFNRATRDGFACRADEANARPLRVSGTVRAGEMWAGVLERYAAIEIMTGAPVPSGADCVVMVEHTTQKGAHIRLREGRSLSSGDNIVSTGSEAVCGATLLPSGTRLGAQHIAQAAACGQARLRVFRKPRISVQATGDELVEIDQAPLAFQIRNSNSYSLAAQIEQCGGCPLVLPILRDSREATEAAIASSLNDPGADLLLFSGGVSMGRFDFVEAALRNLGAEFFFTGAKIQPGKPVVFGRLPRREPGRWAYFFALPGNPISTMVTFALFVHPFINALSGETGGAPRFALAHLDGEVEINKSVTRFLPATLETGKLIPRVRPIPWKGSGDLASNARGNCYLVVPGQLDDGRKTLEAGETVSVLLIG